MRFLFVLLLSVLPSSIWADEYSAQFTRLMEAMRMNEVVGILVEEGREASIDLEVSMFPGRGGAAWEGELDRIYARETRQVQLKREMKYLMSGTDMAPLLEFLESDRGQRIMALEVSARRAFMDPEMEEIAAELYADAEEELPVLYAQVQDFTDVNDLVTQNVEGAFRSNAAFALGAHEAGAFPGMSVDQLIAEMWDGDEAATADISGWIYAYLMTAYRPLSPEDMDAYIALSASEPGQQLNAAIMGAFDKIFADIAYDLGSAAGRFMAQQDL